MQTFGAEMRSPEGHRDLSNLNQLLGKRIGGASRPRRQSNFSPAARTTSSQRGPSSASSAAKSRAEPPSGSLPSLLSASFMSSAVSAALMARLKRAVTSVGRPGGPETPVHDT